MHDHEAEEHNQTSRLETSYSSSRSFKLIQEHLQQLTKNSHRKQQSSEESSWVLSHEFPSATTNEGLGEALGGAAAMRAARVQAQQQQRVQACESGTREKRGWREGPVVIYRSKKRLCHIMDRHPLNDIQKDDKNIQHTKLETHGR
jgi:hypothetical protein